MIWIVFGAMAVATLLAVGRIVIDADSIRAGKSVRVASGVCWAAGLALTMTGKLLFGLTLMAIGAVGVGAFAPRAAPSGIGEGDRRRRPTGRGPHFEGHADPRRGGGVPPRRSGVMTEEEAYEILGLKPGASLEEVARAHRALMKKVHPDQGGATDLAARVNAAKDVLTAQRHR